MQERTLWRIVLTEQPTIADFLSNEAQGKAPRDDDPKTLRLWSGISVYATQVQARRTARLYPQLGRFLAEIRLPAGQDVRVERTRGRGHHTLWADPEALLASVIRVVPA